MKNRLSLLKRILFCSLLIFLTANVSHAETNFQTNLISVEIAPALSINANQKKHLVTNIEDEPKTIETHLDELELQILNSGFCSEIANNKILFLNGRLENKNLTSFHNVLSAFSSCLNAEEMSTRLIELHNALEESSPLYKAKTSYELIQYYINVSAAIEISRGTESSTNFLAAIASNHPYTENSSELYELAIERYLEQNSYFEAISLGEKFVSDLSNLDDLWFQDIVLSRLLLAKSLHMGGRTERANTISTEILDLFLPYSQHNDIHSVPDLSWLSGDDLQNLNELALLFDRQERYSDAILSYQIAISIYEQFTEQFTYENGTPYFGTYIDIVSNYVATLNGLESQKDKADFFTKKFLERNQSALQDYPIEHAHLLNTYAVALLADGQIDEAEMILKEGVELLEQVESYDSYWLLAQLHNNLGFLYADYERANYHFERSLEHSLKTNETFGAARTIANIGVLSLEFDRETEALNIYKRIKDDFNIDENLFAVANFLVGMIERHNFTGFLETAVIEELIEYNLLFLYSNTMNLYLRDSYLWLPDLNSSSYLAGILFDALYNHCFQSECFFGYTNNILTDIIQFSEISMVSLANQISINLSDEERVFAATFLAKLYENEDLFRDVYLQKSAEDIVFEASDYLQDIPSNLKDMRIDFSLFDTHELELSDDQIIVKFFDSGNYLYRLSISSEDFDVIRITTPLEKIKRRFEALSNAMNSSTQEAVQKQILELSEIIFQNLKPNAFDGKRISISPEYFMKKLPISVFLLDQERMIQVRSLTTIPAFSTRFLDKQEKQNSLDMAFLGIGAPKFRGNEIISGGNILTELFRGNVSTTEYFESFPPLPNAAKELQKGSVNLSKIGATKYIIGLNATRKNTLDILNNNSSMLITFATHGITPDENNLGIYPSLLLQPTKKGSADAFLSTAAIMSSSIKAKVVYLSSCNSAASNKSGSEDWDGFVNAFFYAGAESVIASSWNVNDTSSSILHDIFTLNLASGIEPDIAFTDSIRKLAVDNEFSHPKFWAAYSYFSGI